MVAGQSSLSLNNCFRILFTFLSRFSIEHSLTHTFHTAVLPSRNIYWRTTNRLPLPQLCLIPNSTKRCGRGLRRAILHNQKVPYILPSLASNTISPRDVLIASLLHLVLKGPLTCYRWCRICGILLDYVLLALY